MIIKYYCYKIFKKIKKVIFFKKKKDTKKEFIY